MSIRYGMGWQRDIPDLRDYTFESEEIQELLGKSKAFAAAPALAKKLVDLSTYCSPIEDQGSLGSCTAQAGIGLLEYYENRAFGGFLDGSRLFLYKVTRSLLGWTGDTGAWLRTTMKAMALFGTPPESYYPYNIAKFDEEPTAFCYSFGQNYKAIRYYRLDPPGTQPADLLTRVKHFLLAGFPSMFGFTVFNFGNAQGEFAFPNSTDSVKGGHAVVAIGYDDERQIGNEVGAIRVRNSWGTSWGEQGYGWIPYRYIEEGLAVDFWNLFKADYVPLTKFN